MIRSVIFKLGFKLLYLHSHTFQLPNGQSQVLKHTISFLTISLGCSLEERLTKLASCIADIQDRREQELGIFFPFQLEKRNSNSK